MIEVQVWADVVCPWCYLGRARLRKAAVDLEVRIVDRSFELDPGFVGESTVVDMLAKKYGVSPAEAAAMEERVARLAEDEGLPFAVDRPYGNTFDFHRLRHLATELDVDLLDRAYAAYFGEGSSLFTQDSLLALADKLPANRAAAVLAGDEFGDAVRADEQRAQRLGATGVPFFVAGQHAVAGAQPVEVLRRLLELASAS